MEHFQIQLTKLIELTGFHEVAVHYDIEGRRVEIFVNEGDWLKRWLPNIVSEFDHIAKLVAKKNGIDAFLVDINNYRKERESIIVELAKAAAKKAAIAKQEVRLPVMNAYERRLVHVELAVRPDVKTESEGVGKERCVVVKPLV